MYIPKVKERTVIKICERSSLRMVNLKAILVRDKRLEPISAYQVESPDINIQMKMINPPKSLLRNVLPISEICQVFSTYQTLAKALCCLI